MLYIVSLTLNIVILTHVAYHDSVGCETHDLCCESHSYVSSEVRGSVVVINKVAMKRLKQTSDQRRQKKVADARKEKGVQAIKLFLDKEALVALRKLAEAHGYEKILMDENVAGKTDEASALVSFCLRFVADIKDGDQTYEIICKKCQEYYQTRQVAIHLREAAEMSDQELLEKLYVLRLRTLTMIETNQHYGGDSFDNQWKEKEITDLFELESFKKTMGRLKKSC